MSATVGSGWRTHELGKCTGAVAYSCSSHPYLLKTDGCIRTHMRTVTLTNVSCEREFYVKIQAVRAKIQTNRVITHSSPSTWERRRTRWERAAGKETQRKHRGYNRNTWKNVAHIIDRHCHKHNAILHLDVRRRPLSQLLQKYHNCKSKIISTQFVQGKRICDRLV